MNLRPWFAFTEASVAAGSELRKELSVSTDFDGLADLSAAPIATMLSERSRGRVDCSDTRDERSRIMKYKLLGNSGLRVSDAALGTMTFGDERGWGSPKDEARKV
jgi:hypothetical protein